MWRAVRSGDVGLVSWPWGTRGEKLSSLRYEHLPYLHLSQKPIDCWVAVRACLLGQLGVLLLMCLLILRLSIDARYHVVIRCLSDKSILSEKLLSAMSSL